MLKGKIRFEELGLDPQVIRGEIKIGSSCLVVHPSEFLECLLVQSQERWFAVFRERQAHAGWDDRIRHITVTSKEYGKLYAEAVVWPLEYFLVEALPEERRIQIRSGAIGAAPVYCYATSTELILSWDFADFKRCSTSIDTEALVAALTLSTQYSAKQMLHGVYMITERATYTVSPDEAFFKYPEPKNHIANLGDISRGEYLEVISSELKNLLLLRPTQTQPIAVELSGGVDSAVVAATLKNGNANFKTFGVLLQNETAEFQIDRREQLLKLFDAKDITVNLADYMPNLEPDHRRNESYGVLEDFYIEAFAALWDKAELENCNAIYKGFGGDELGGTSAQIHGFPSAGSAITSKKTCSASCYLTPKTIELAGALRAFDAPSSPVPHSALIAQARHAPYALKRGLWPVNLLSDPRVVDLSLRFPLELRADRVFLHNLINEHAGYKLFRAGYVKETFLGVLPDVIRKSADRIRPQLNVCLLSDMGFVERSDMIAVIDYISSTKCEKASLQLAVTLLIERFLRSL